ncbi:UNVERIFIED_ORG: group 4 capsule polysaccharide lipoprotein GfcB/YjbF [Idiomarina abyssalis]|uniref:YjbF family lipoprotein n=1 Tax=Idiomarina sp. 017G TaxID=2183988 RepID=UPI000E0E66BB|nr:YjbF family lipoprotein [Idiomarina sp. 017G]TDO50216.1 group 4 capsule polysaccharide lipoprotein GfcB/YjbF [Idiomarina sp. 017G]
MLIRYCLLALLGVVTYGCTAVTDEVRETVEYAFKTQQDAELSSEEIENFPYTSLYAQWKAQPRTLIVLGFIDKPNDRHFITAEKETLVVRNGRVIRTQGLNRNLLAVSNLKQDPLQCIITEPNNCKTRWQRNYDYQMQEQTFSRTVASQFAVLEEQTLEMPFGKVSATLVEESGRFELSGETFTNRFWVESDGHVVKSEQQLFPNKASLTLTQVTWIGREYSNKAAK